MNLSVKILQQTQIIMKKEGRKLREFPVFSCIPVYDYSSSNKLSCSCFLPLLFISTTDTPQRKLIASTPLDN